MTTMSAPYSFVDPLLSRKWGYSETNFRYDVRHGSRFDDNSFKKSSNYYRKR